MTSGNLCRPRGLWLNWCDVDGYTTSACSCSHGKQKEWFPNWDSAEQADKARRLAQRVKAAVIGPQ